LDEERSRSISAVEDVTRAVRLCLHFLEERGDGSAPPETACVVGGGSAAEAVAQAVAATLPLRVVPVCDALVPLVRPLIQALPPESVVDDWLVPMGLSIYGMFDARVGALE
jgi:hypothetical protein